ncbi:hypothetical protein Droror1_Dr00026028 [Drosera rotundifolia]
MDTEMDASILCFLPFSGLGEELDSDDEAALAVAAAVEFDEELPDMPQGYEEEEEEEEEEGIREVWISIWTLELCVGAGADIIPIIRFGEKGAARKKKKKKGGWGMGEVGISMWTLELGVSAGAGVISITRSAKKGVARKKKKKKKKKGGWERGWKEEEERGIGEVGISMWELELGIGAGANVIPITRSEKKGIGAGADEISVARSGKKLVARRRRRRMRRRKKKKKRGWGRLGYQCVGAGVDVIPITRSGKKRVTRMMKNKKGGWGGSDINVSVGIRRLRWCRRNSGYSIWKGKGCKGKKEEERGMGEVKISMWALDLGIGAGVGIISVTRFGKKGVARKKKKKCGWVRLGYQCGRWS